MNRKPQLISAGIILALLAVIVIGIALAVFLAVFFTRNSSSSEDDYPDSMNNYRSYKNSIKQLRIAMISDDDKETFDNKTFRSHMYIGTIDTTEEKWKYTQTEAIDFSTGFNILASKSRGNELSDLVWFYDTLYSFDDKTGIGFEMDTVNKNMYPRMIFAGSNGTSKIGMKVEWSTVMGDQMVIGSHGNTHWDGREDYQNSYVHYIDKDLSQETVAWIDEYENINRALNITYPGYVTNEAISYSNQNDQWYVFPRKVSEEEYNETRDYTLSSEYFLICDNNVNNCKKYRDPQRRPERCFSSIFPVPYNEKIVVYTKSVENESGTESYIGAVSFDGVEEGKEGKIIMDEVQITDKYKIEGVELLPANF